MSDTQFRLSDYCYCPFIGITVDFQSYSTELARVASEYYLKLYSGLLIAELLFNDVFNHLVDYCGDCLIPHCVSMGGSDDRWQQHFIC